MARHEISKLWRVRFRRQSASQTTFLDENPHWKLDFGRPVPAGLSSQKYFCCHQSGSVAPKRVSKCPKIVLPSQNDWFSKSTLNASFQSQKKHWCFRDESKYTSYQYSLHDQQVSVVWKRVAWWEIVLRISSVEWPEASILEALWMNCCVSELMRDTLENISWKTCEHRTFATMYIFSNMSPINSETQ